MWKLQLVVINLFTNIACALGCRAFMPGASLDPHAQGGVGADPGQN